MIKPKMVQEVNDEMARAMAKWGRIDEDPHEIVNAVAEELLEVIHSVNHRESRERIHDEIIQAIGVLVRLDDLVQG